MECSLHDLMGGQHRDDPLIAIFSPQKSSIGDDPMVWVCLFGVSRTLLQFERRLWLTDMAFRGTMFSRNQIGRVWPSKVQAIGTEKLLHSQLGYRLFKNSGLVSLREPLNAWAKYRGIVFTT